MGFNRNDLSRVKKPFADGWHQIGSIGVDAGLCWIGDPCYVLHKDADRRYRSIGKDWGDFCNQLPHDQLKLVEYDPEKPFKDEPERGFNWLENPYWEGELAPAHKSFPYDMGHEGLGVVVRTGDGDGHCPVYARYEDGRIQEVRVSFDGARPEGLPEQCVNGCKEAETNE